MLFKRKGGNHSKKGQRKGRSENKSERPDQSVPHVDDSSSSRSDWDVEARQEMASLFDKAKRTESLEDTRRAVAQRRASKKMASIDWDVAAREEITALFGNENGQSAPNGNDSDLESVRRAIAEKKRNAASSSQKKNTADEIDIPVDLNADEEDQGPRLDWLVDFISDDEKPAPRPEQPSEPAQRPEPSPNYGLQEIEIVPRTPPGKDDSINLDSGVIMGDGFGNVHSESTDAPGSDPGGEAFFDGIVEEEPKPKAKPVRSAPGRRRTRPVPPPAKQNQQPPADAQPARNLPESRRAVDLEALKTKDRVVAILLKKQIVKMSQVYEAQKLKERENTRETLWRILVEMQSVDKDAIYEEAARIYAFPIANTEGKLDAKFVRSVMETLSPENRDRLLNLHLVPFECETEQQSGNVKLVFITHDPMRTEVRKVMKELKLDRFDLYYAPKAAVDTLIAEAFPRKNEFLERMTEDPMAFDLGMSYEEADLIDEDALEAEISRSTLINLFEATLVEAVRQGASDVHIYPNAKKRVEIHFRVDGRLTLWHTEHKVHPEALLAVIKDNAMNVDRFERDAAQDGYIQRWIDDVLIRFRVSVLPIANVSHEIRSESIVIRVLDDRKVIRDLSKLGLLPEAMHKFEQAIRQPHGMVILTGPTGSGKSTSLVAALHHVITGEVNVLTVEDPVEYIIPGVRQIKLNYKLELENALRAILRHDPDIVMVGEMRDRKTAELAIKLANTGHLTFSTLHTNDAPSAISRLYKMGIEPFLIAYAINLIVAQRLIRELCSRCKQPDVDPDPVMLEQLGFTREEIANLTFYVPGNDSDCPNCKGIGYKGRRAICEALYFSREIRHKIVEADKMIDEGAIKEQAVKEGMLTLRDSAREIVKMGLTSVREMIRVVTSDT